MRTIAHTNGIGVWGVRLLVLILGLYRCGSDEPRQSEWDQDSTDTSAADPDFAGDAVDARADAETAIDTIDVRASMGRWIGDPNAQEGTVIAVYLGGATVVYEPAEPAMPTVPVELDGAPLAELWAHGEGTGFRAVVGIDEVPFGPGEVVDLSMVELDAEPHLVSGAVASAGGVGSALFFYVWPGYVQVDSEGARFVGATSAGEPGMFMRGWRTSEEWWSTSDGVTTMRRMLLALVDDVVPRSEVHEGMVVLGRDEFEANFGVEGRLQVRWTHAIPVDVAWASVQDAVPSVHNLAVPTGAWTEQAVDVRRRLVDAQVVSLPTPDWMPEPEPSVFVYSLEHNHTAFFERSDEPVALELLPAISGTHVRRWDGTNTAVVSDLDESGVERRVVLKRAENTMGIVTVRGRGVSEIAPEVVERIDELTGVDGYYLVACEPHPLHAAACQRSTIDIERTRFDEAWAW